MVLHLKFSLCERCTRSITHASIICEVATSYIFQISIISKVHIYFVEVTLRMLLKDILGLTHDTRSYFMKVCYHFVHCARSENCILQMFGRSTYGRSNKHTYCLYVCLLLLPNLDFFNIKIFFSFYIGLITETNELSNSTAMFGK